MDSTFKKEQSRQGRVKNPAKKHSAGLEKSDDRKAA